MKINENKTLILIARIFVIILIIADLVFNVMIFIMNRKMKSDISDIRHDVISIEYDVNDIEDSVYKIRKEIDDIESDISDIEYYLR